jgi:hypothetical protein
MFPSFYVGSFNRDPFPERANGSKQTSNFQDGKNYFSWFSQDRSEASWHLHMSRNQLCNCPHDLQPVGFAADAAAYKTKTPSSIW